MSARPSRRLFSALPALCVLCACSHQPVKPAAPLPGTEACIWIRNIFSWDVIDQTTLIVYDPQPNNPYLVKLFAPVIELPFKERIGFQSTAGSDQLCKMDDLLVRGEAPHRTPIVAIRKITPAQAKALLKPAKPAASGSSSSSSGAG